tara:strand:+ start:37 stop:519 length:483 start_codon:yes stop_codon:yes gene_type:complete
MGHMKKWYLIKTKPRQEQIAILNLERQHYYVYCPSVLINQKNVVLFPGYLFIQLDSEMQNWSPIKSTKGVLNFVRFGLKYARISDSIIDFIRVNELNTREKIVNFNEFRAGDRVEITEGVFKNCIAIVKSIKSDERVVLLMKLLGQQQSINIKKKSLIGI